MQRYHLINSTNDTFVFAYFEYVLIHFLWYLNVRTIANHMILKRFKNCFNFHFVKFLTKYNPKRAFIP